jgi:sulfide:quinone oxidoreductase
MFGRQAPSAVLHRYADLRLPGVRFVATTVVSIDAAAKRVETEAGSFEADTLVVALGADIDAAATPGLVEGGHEFYSVQGAIAVRDVLAAFDGGSVLVGVTSTPFKCPPAPSETALLMHDFLVERGLRGRSSISLAMPFGTPIPPSPQASAAVLDAFAARGIAFLPGAVVTALDVERQVASMSDGTEVAYDLFLGVPVHRAPAVVLESGLAVDGWIPVDPGTLETRFPGVYAVGDVTSVGTPKAGVFAEGAAAVVAAQLVAAARGERSDASYDGRGMCYIELGAHRVARVDVSFFDGPPSGTLDGPSEDLVADKVEFGTTRVARWGLAPPADGAAAG